MAKVKLTYSTEPDKALLESLEKDLENMDTEKKNENNNKKTKKLLKSIVLDADDD